MCIYNFIYFFLVFEIEALIYYAQLHPSYMEKTPQFWTNISKTTVSTNQSNGPNFTYEYSDSGISHILSSKELFVEVL